MSGNFKLWRYGLLWLLVCAEPLHAANMALVWDAATDNVAVTGYRVYWRIAPAAYTVPNSVDMGNTLTGTVTGLTANQLYYFCVTAHDGATPTPNEGPCSQEIGVFTGPTTPTAPTFLRQVAMSCREVRLRWNPSFDDLAVTQYRMRRNGAQVGTTAGTVRLYDDMGVSPSTGYTYVVRAADASANESGDSNSVVVTTPACP